MRVIEQFSELTQRNFSNAAISGNILFHWLSFFLYSQELGMSSSLILLNESIYRLSYFVKILCLQRKDNSPSCPKLTLTQNATHVVKPREHRGLFFLFFTMKIVTKAYWFRKLIKAEIGFSSSPKRLTAPIHAVIITARTHPKQEGYISFA